MQIDALHIWPPTFLAPMAAVSDLPFRRLCRELGVGLVTTELISINALVLSRGKQQEFSRRLLRTHPSERPRGVQLFGADPKLFAEASKIAVEEGADLIDINMGCPVSKVCKLGAGAALLKDPDHAARLVEAASHAVKVPVTVKMRAGWGSAGPEETSYLNSVEIAKRLHQAGARAIAVHARTRTQGYAGRADWRIIAAITQALPIPVIGNGDVFSPMDALRMVQETKCDGVMMGRGAMENPLLLQQAGLALCGQPFVWPSPLAERARVATRHLQLAVEQYGQMIPFEMRNQLRWYARGLQRSGELRERLSLLFTLRDYLDVIDWMFAGGESSEKTFVPLEGTFG
jgi:tRNA-dihydrouridine synthase B